MFMAQSSLQLEDGFVGDRRGPIAKPPSEIERVSLRIQSIVLQVVPIFFEVPLRPLGGVVESNYEIAPTSIDTAARNHRYRAQPRAGYGAFGILRPASAE